MCLKMLRRILVWHNYGLINGQIDVEMNDESAQSSESTVSGHILHKSAGHFKQYRNNGVSLTAQLFASLWNHQY